METEVPVSNENSNKMDSEKDRDETKSRLKKQIEELKTIILEMECSLDIAKFGNTKPAHDLDVPQSPIDTDIYEIPNINIKLQSELYRYSGLYCVQFSCKQNMFKFSALNRYDKENTFAVQILNKQNVGTLGKWIMPMSVDLDDLKSEFSINELRNVPHFIKTCKHYIDCYTIRRQQFKALKDSICGIQNCALQTNLGYTCINLELTGVHDANNDVYINIIVYLMYNINGARPHKIEVDSKTGDELNVTTKQQLCTSLKCLKRFDLETAFHKMLIEKPFVWSRKEETDSPFETNRLSPDEQGYLENFSFTQKERSKPLKGQKKSEIKLRGTKRISDFPESFENNDQPVSQENKEPGKNLNRYSMRLKNTDTTKSTREIKAIKPEKLKQTKLRLPVDNNSELRADDNIITSRVAAIKKKSRIAELSKPITSTPIRPSTSRLVSVMSLNSISDIPLNEDDSYDTKTKTNADVPKQTEPLSKNQTGNNVLAKKLGSGMKRAVKSSIRSKPITKKKTVARKKLKKI